MLKAVQHCHEHGIIHKDVKMENFLLDYEEATGKVSVELTDFGISVCEQECQGIVNERLGTATSMAPEIIMPHKYGADFKITTKVDCWSLGVILYELLTAQLPFYHKNQSELFRRICYQNLNTHLLQSYLGISPQCIDLLNNLL